MNPAIESPMKTAAKRNEVAKLEVNIEKTMRILSKTEAN
jgi:hypothetical protein